MNEEHETMSWKEKMRLNKRALALWYREYPVLLMTTAVYAAINAALPYITIYFSAQILNELAGERQKELLVRRIVLLLVLEAVVLLVKAAFYRWNNSISNEVCRYLYDHRRYLDKMLSMDFCTAEDPAVHEQLNAIRQTAQWGSWGMEKAYMNFRQFVEAGFQMLGGIALSVSLFTLPVRADAGVLTVLNSPLCIAVIAALMAGVAVLSPYMENIGTKCWVACDEEMRLSNRFFRFRMNLMTDNKCALDIRMYRQDILVSQIDDVNSGFATNSRIAGYARGRMGLAGAASAALSRLFIGIVYLFVCLKAWGGAFGVGSVTQYIGALTALAGGFSKLLETVGNAGINAGYLKHTFDFLDIPNPMYQGSLTVEKRSDKKYEVEFRNVSFRYPNTDKDVLKNISLKFQVGGRLALVGQNGSGKTTFIKLLCRLYDPTEGEILLNGIDIRKYNYLEYMQVFSVVFQDFRLLAFPVGQNLAAAAAYDSILAENSCRKAGVWERVVKMRDGLDTFLYKDMDEEGVLVSGGEEQKLAIARALYRDSAFLILDEPTAALDPIAEYEIYTKLNEIVGDRTAIYISHRLASCRFCDEIIVFHEGRMVQQGSHETLLMQGGGKYSELWNAQAQYCTEG